MSCATPPPELPDRIAETFVDKNIFITGGTGFLGKVFIEKLLRSCGGLKTIYVLIRPKKGKTPQQRLKDLFDSPLFGTLKQEQSFEEILKKIRLVSGDVEAKGLGLASADREELTSHVHIIYHSAASVRFDDPLSKAVILNTRGTKQMLDLAKECKHLLLFAHISTAYSQPNVKHLLEKFYEPPADPHMIIQLVESHDPEDIEKMSTKILGNIPNTYAFTKALAEALVGEQVGHLPVIVLRPSVVIPILKEPICGWTDNLNGPTGLLIGAGKGVIRTMLCKGEVYADFAPVDWAIHNSLCITWNYLSNKDVDRKVYNMTTSAEYKVTWKEIIEMGKEIVRNRMPFNGIVWYPGGSIKSSLLQHNIAMVLFHYIPAILVDTLLVLTGHKPVLWRVHQRISKGFDVLSYYVNHQWDFSSENSIYLRGLLTEKEATIYKVLPEEVDYMEYITCCCHAARLYLMKESDESLPAARRHTNRLWWVDRITKVLFVIFIFWLLKKLFFPI